MSEIDEIVRAHRMAARAKSDEMHAAVLLAAGLETREVTTTVELRCEPTEWPGEGGTFDRVRVAVTRFIGEGHAEGNDPYYRAEAYLTPHDRRKPTRWAYIANSEPLVRQLIGRALI